MHLLIGIVLFLVLIFMVVNIGVLSDHDIAMRGVGAEIAQWGDDMLVWRDTAHPFRPVMYSDVTTAPYRQNRRTSSRPVSATRST